jgi:hypothetical protein
MYYRNWNPLILFYQSQDQSQGPSIPDVDGPRQQSDSGLIKIEPLVDPFLLINNSKTPSYSHNS